ncbi:hypothetical protein Scep_007576 [Stephania cephalantha]|uniref:Uncharacterized protein n=1 Tax=Stephania cephalantha TaxID=152367 RepID=A0AAP0KC44_9MAGN
MESIEVVVSGCRREGEMGMAMGEVGTEGERGVEVMIKALFGYGWRYLPGDNLQGVGN